MEEFRIAHAQVTEKNRKNFLIPLLYEDVKPNDLDADLKLYVETHTYIETKNLVKSINLDLFLKSPHSPEPWKDYFCIPFL